VIYGSEWGKVYGENDERWRGEDLHRFVYSETERAVELCSRSSRLVRSIFTDMGPSHREDVPLKR
jgi:hypothetical protein